MNIPDRLRGVAVAALVLIGGVSGARGDFLPTLSVAQDTGASGLFRYTYTLTNGATSTQLASLFQLNVAPDADLQAIGNTIGWDVTYAPGASEIIWTSAIQADFSTNDLAPGLSGTFSFESTLGPANQPYLIVGLDPAGGLGGTVEGTVLGPSVVPEPSGIVLLVLGATGLVVSGRRGSRRPS